LLTGEFHFGKDVRLLKPADFRRVFQQAVKVHGPGFTLFARRNGLGRARLGMAVGKKAVRRAVDRNRIRRLVRESFRHHKNDLSSLDIVFLARKEILAHSRAMLSEHLNLAWKRLEKRCAS